jgi:hypothetical protein
MIETMQMKILSIDASEEVMGDSKATCSYALHAWCSTWCSTSRDALTGCIPGDWGLSTTTIRMGRCIDDLHLHLELQSCNH